MLVYRRVGDKMCLPQVTDDMVPAELRKQIQEENAKFTAEKLEHEKKKDHIMLRIFYQKKSYNLQIDRNSTLQQLLVS